MDQLADRVAVVTGAASGIGLAVAEALCLGGTQVMVTDLDGDAAAAVAARLVEHGGSAESLPLDVRDPAAVEDAGRRVVEQFGRLHIAVNNAGIVNRGYSWELELDEWHRVLDVDLWGVIHGVRAFVPRILDSGEQGHVVNVASMAAVLPLDRLGPYTVAKHGVLGLSDVLRAEMEAIGAPVGVSVVMPGMIRTAMNPVGKVDPTQVAANVLDAIRRGRPYVFTDDHSTDQVRARLQQILTARAEVLAP